MSCDVVGNCSIGLYATEAVNDIETRAFAAANPLLIALTGENACVVPVRWPSTGVVMVFTSNLQAMDDNEITFIVAHEVAHVVLRNGPLGHGEQAADALAAAWGFRRGAGSVSSMDPSKNGRRIEKGGLDGD